MARLEQTADGNWSHGIAPLTTWYGRTALVFVPVEQNPNQSTTERYCGLHPLERILPVCV